MSYTRYQEKISATNTGKVASATQADSATTATTATSATTATTATSATTAVTATRTTTVNYSLVSLADVENIIDSDGAVRFTIQITSTGKPCWVGFVPKNDPANFAGNDYERSGIRIYRGPHDAFFQFRRNSGTTYKFTCGLGDYNIGTGTTGAWVEFPPASVFGIDFNPPVGVNTYTITIQSTDDNPPALIGLIVKCDLIAREL